MANSKKLPALESTNDGDLYELFLAWTAQDESLKDAALITYTDGSGVILSANRGRLFQWRLKSDAVTWFKAVIQ